MLAVAVVASLGVMTASLAVADVTAACVASSPNEAGEEATYTIVFATTEDLEAGHYIRIEFPGGTDIAAVAADHVTVDGASVAGVVKVDERLDIQLATNHVAGPRGVTVLNVINPTEAGDYTLDISTTEEPTSVESLTYTIAAATAESIKILPEEITIAAGETQAYTAEAYDAYENLVGDVTDETEFAIVEPGHGGEWGAGESEDNVYTAKFIGEWTVRGNYTGITGTATLVVEPGAVETLNITRQPTDTIAGEAIAPAVTVNATDEYSQLIPELPITASLVVDGGGTLHGTRTQETDNDGVATFDDLWIDLEGKYELLFTAEGKTVESEAFNITRAAMAKLLIIPQTANIAAGDIQEYEADLADEFGNVVTSNVTEWVNFEIDNASNGTFIVNVLHDAVAAGTWEITGTYTPDDDITGNATLVVEPAAAVDLSISPKTAEVTGGDQQTYTASAEDEFGNIFDVTAKTAFKIEPGAGGVWKDNVYTSDSRGKWTVTGSYAGLEDSAILRVRFSTCFIATAAYGTPAAEEIDILREFRDAVLLPDGLGAKLVSLYYQTSPPIAELISQNEALRTAVRVGLIAPIVAVLEWSQGLWS